MNKQQKIIDKRYIRKHRTCRRLIVKLKYLLNHPISTNYFSPVFLRKIDYYLNYVLLYMQ